MTGGAKFISYIFGCIFSPAFFQAFSGSGQVCTCITCPSPLLHVGFKPRRPWNIQRRPCAAEPWDPHGIKPRESCRCPFAKHVAWCSLASKSQRFGRIDHYGPLCWRQHSAVGMPHWALFGEEIRTHPNLLPQFHYGGLGLLAGLSHLYEEGTPESGERLSSTEGSRRRIVHKWFLCNSTEGMAGSSQAMLLQQRHHTWAVASRFQPQQLWGHVRSRNRSRSMSRGCRHRMFEILGLHW